MTDYKKEILTVFIELAEVVRETFNKEGKFKIPVLKFYEIRKKCSDLEYCLAFQPQEIDPKISIIIHYLIDRIIIELNELANLSGVDKDKNLSYNSFDKYFNAIYDDVRKTKYVLRCAIDLL